MGKIHYLITANNQDFIDKMNQVKGEIRKTSGLATSTAGDFGKLGTAVAGAFSVAAVSALGKEIVKVRGDVQALEQSFNVLAGAKGGALFEEIRRFAVETPLGMQELAKSAQTLLSFNVEAERIMPLLRQIGDISMGDSQKLQSLTLAFAQMSSTGKLMGQDLLQMINAGFNPLSVISGKTGKSIGALRKEMESGAISAEMVADAFATATGEGGKFNGMLEQQSKGIKGMVSNFEGAVEDMFNKIGEQSEGIITGAVGVATDLVENYEQVGKVLLDIVAAYGAYKAATIAVSAVEVFRNKVLAESTIIMSNYAKEGIFMSRADAVAAAKTKLLTAAKQSLIKVMNGAKAALTNPYVLATAAVAGLIFGIYKLVTAKSAEEKAQERVNEQLEKWNDEADKAKTKSEELTRTIQSETSTTLQRYQAWKDLIALYPEIENTYTQQQWAAMSAAEQEKYLAEMTDKRREAQLRAAMAEAKADIKKYKRSGATSKEKAASLEYDQYSKELNQLLEERRKAEWEAQPVEVKLVSLDNNIAKLNSEIAEIDRLIAEEEQRQKDSGFVLISDEMYLRELKNRRARFADQREQKQIQRSGLEATLTPENVTNLREVTAQLIKAQADLDKARNAYAKSGTKANKTALENAEKAVATLSTTFKDMTGKTWEQYNKEQEKIDPSQYIIKGEQAISKARIAAMREGREKELAEIEASFQAEMAEIEREYQELVKKYEELGQKVPEAVTKAYENNKKAAKKSAQGSIMSLIRSDFSADVDESEVLEDEKRFERQQEALAKALQAQNEYIREYGSMEAKKAEIVAYYNSEISKATTDVEQRLLEAKKATELFNLAMAEIEKGNSGFFAKRRKAIKEYYSALIIANTNLDEQIALLHEMDKALQNVDIEQAQQIAQQVGDIASAFSSLGDVVGSNVLSEAGSALSDLAGAVGNVAQGFASGGAVGAIVAGITSVIDLAVKAVEKYYAAMQEEAQLIQDQMNAYDEYFQSVINGATSATDAVNAYNDAMRENDRLAKEAKKELRESGRGNLANKSGEELQAWMRENLEEYNDLPEYVKTHIDTIINAEESAEELRNQLQEKLTGISFDGVKDNIRSALLDGTNDATKNVEDMMRTAIVNGISDAFEEDWQKWYDNFSAAFEDGTLTPEEAAALREQANAIYGAQKAQKDAAMGVAGIESKARSANASAVTQASQDSIDYMNGQLTLGNHTLLSIDTHLLDTNATLAKLLSGNAVAITHLSNIAKNTDSIPVMAQSLERMRTTLDSIQSNGLKMR